MLGAIIGDIVGSPFEFDANNIKTEEFDFISCRSHFTDDTVMTIAIADGLVQAVEEGVPLEAALVEAMQSYGRRYPNAGYGARFSGWLGSSDPQPYNSYGNGSAMRISAMGWLFDSMKAVEKAAELSAAVTHNHPEGIKGAVVTAGAVYLARTGHTKREIEFYVQNEGGYDTSRTLDEIRPSYHHVESCQETVPQAMSAFLQSRGFEDALRKAVSLGGDSDTLAAITGSVAEAYYGIPEELKRLALAKLDAELLATLEAWHEQLPTLREKAYNMEL